MTWDSENIINNEFPKVFQAIDEFLKPKNMGFELVFSDISPNQFPTIVYKSKKCKVRIVCSRDRPYEGIEITRQYGRLHAPLDKDIIDWRNEKHYCWHSLYLSRVYNFLDGLSPVDAISKPLNGIPKVVRDFIDSNKGKGLSGPEFFAKKEAIIWKHYGQKVFDLFDLRNPNLWEEYSNFFKEYVLLSDEQRINFGNKVIGKSNKPSKYKIC